MKTFNITSLEQELIRFFVVGKLFLNETGNTPYMPTCIVDKAWHELLKDKVKYPLLTSKFVGSRIDHIKNNGYGEILWIKMYEKHYGKLSKEWFTSSTGSFNFSSYEEYLRTGKLYASWDCSPGYNSLEEESLTEKEIETSNTNSISNNSLCLG